MYSKNMDSMVVASKTKLIDFIEEKKKKTSNRKKEIIKIKYFFRAQRKLFIF